jgi:hypothetical protein
MESSNTNHVHNRHSIYIPLPCPAFTL